MRIGAPASVEEALINLGSEKLTRQVIDEAKRNAAFRKLVAAVLAGEPLLAVSPLNMLW
jgi:hypothetical protein